MKCYICKKCGWSGAESELEYDDVETCMGNDKIEMCPKCGSLEVVENYASKEKK